MATNRELDFIDALATKAKRVDYNFADYLHNAILERIARGRGSECDEMMALRHLAAKNGKGESK